MKVPGLLVTADAVELEDSLDWRSTRSSGVAWVDLGATDDGSRTTLIRMTAGHGYPAHRHIGPEDVLVLRGGYRDDDGAVHTAGDFVRYPAGSVHAPVALASDHPSGADICLLFAVAHRGTSVLEDPVAEAGDDRTARQPGPLSGRGTSRP